MGEADLEPDRKQRGQEEHGNRGSDQRSTDQHDGKRPGAHARRRLGIGGGTTRVKAHMPFHPLLHLMDMAIQRRHRARAPAPILIQRPQRKMRQHDNRRGGREPREISLKPGELVGTQRAHALGTQLHHIDQRHEMHAVGIETVPAIAQALRGEAGDERPRIIAVHHGVLAGHDMDGAGRFRPTIAGQRRQSGPIGELRT